VVPRTTLDLALDVLHFARLGLRTRAHAWSLRTSSSAGNWRCTSNVKLSLVAPAPERA